MKARGLRVRTKPTAEAPAPVVLVATNPVYLADSTGKLLAATSGE